jgi:drug/metabolite transporter (DMT)-like permease
MPLTFEIVALVLFSALLHAGWNALLKVSGDRLTVSAVLYGVMALAAAWGMVAAAPPAMASWPFLVASIVLHNVYFLALLMAYRDGDLSRVYPIARGAAPPVVAVLSTTLAGEVLRAGQWLAVGLISAGVLSLALDRRLVRDGQAKAVLYALLTAALIGLYTFVDALGLRRAESVFGYIFWLIALSGAPFVLVVACLRARRFRTLPARLWGRGAVAGLLAVSSYSALLWALSLGAMAPVAALRETSVIFAAVIGAAFLDEPFGGRRILAAAVVAAGVVALNLPA